MSKWLWVLSIFLVFVSFLLPWGNVHGFMSSGLWLRETDKSEGAIFLWGLLVHETFTEEHLARPPSIEKKDSFYVLPFDFQGASFALVFLGLLLIFAGYYHRAPPAVGGVLIIIGVAIFLNGLPSGNVSAATLFAYGSIRTEPSYGYIPAILGALLAFLFTLSRDFARAHVDVE